MNNTHNTKPVRRGRYAPPSTLTVTTRRMKAALIRREGYPVGQPAPMFLRCACGAEVDVPNAFTDERVSCTCGVEYDSRGWIQ